MEKLKKEHTVEQFAEFEKTGREETIGHVLEQGLENLRKRSKELRVKGIAGI